MKTQREYKRPTLTKEERAQRKVDAEGRRYWREIQKSVREAYKKERELAKRELAVLNLMKRQDVKYLHHSMEDSMMEEIKEHIETVKGLQRENRERQKGNDGYSETGPLATSQVRDPYIWNYQDSNSLPRCQMGNIFSSSEFDTIYDVPLDGTYRFEIYDSGQRGLGSFNRMRAVPVDKVVEVPFVNPGGYPPVTAR